MNKKHYKKIFTYLVMIFAIFIVIFLVSGYIPFIGNIIAENKINSYLSATYENHEDVDVGFDFYSFSGYKGGKCSYDIKNDLIFDAEKVEANNKVTVEKIKNATKNFSKDMVFDDYHITTYIDGSDFSKHYDRLIIYFAWNDENISIEESEEKAVENIMNILFSEELSEYNFTSFNVNYNDMHNSYNVSLPKNEKTKITRDVIYENIRKKN